MNSYTLFLANEADNWENATPVGCGKLGAMLWGGVKNECLQLNEERLWAGGPLQLHADGFAEKLAQVRACLREGKNADAMATELLDPYFFRIKSYESAGNLRLAMNADGEVTDYRRELDLVNGIASDLQAGRDCLYPYGICIVSRTCHCDASDIRQARSDCLYRILRPRK